MPSKTVTATLAALMLAVPLATARAQEGEGRWYTERHVALGERLYAEHCAGCHGDQAQGLAEDWRKRGPDGRYPAPPLDGSAHAWHHPLPLLRRTIQQGGKPVGGTMPAFGERLSPAEVDAVIAAFQSRWSDAIYAEWQRRGGLAGARAHPIEEQGDDRLTHLQALVGDAPLGAVEETPAQGVVRVKVGSDYLYVIGEGRYALTGDLLDLERGENLTAAARAQDRLAALASFPEKDRIVFPAKGEERAVLVVFTDTTCPYCRRLHGDVPELQRNGVAVHYVPFPRAGIGGEGAQEMRGVWCADDRRRATDVAMGVRAGDPAKDGDCPAADSVARGYRVGQRLGIRGTPAIVLPDGRLVQGYRPPRALLGAL